jgi:hypothetical protein
LVAPWFGPAAAARRAESACSERSLVAVGIGVHSESSQRLLWNDGDTPFRTTQRLHCSPAVAPAPQADVEVDVAWLEFVPPRSRA